MLGPLGRSADDLDLGLDVLAGPDPARAVAWRLDLPPPRREALSGYRMAAWLDDPACPVDAEVREVLEAAVEALRGAGVQVAGPEVIPVPFAEAARSFQRLLTAAMSGGYPPEVLAMAKQTAASAPESDGEATLLRAARDLTQLHRDWLGADEARHRHRAAWARLFEDVDVVLAATMPVAAFPHDHSDNSLLARTLTVNGEPRPYNDALSWCGIFGAAYLPVAVAPVGRTKSGLPVGIQVVGPFLEDRTVVDVARRLGEVVGGFERPPGF